MLVKVLFLQPPEARLKFSGYSGTTQQLMNEADSCVITLRQEKQHKLSVSVATNKQDPAVSKHGNPYQVGALSVLQALLSEEESSINRKLRSATNSGQAHSDNEEQGSRAEHCDGNERSRHQRWGHRQNDRHRSSRRHYDTHKQGQEQGQRPYKIVVRLVVSTCVVTSVNGRGMSPGSVLAVLRNLIRRATNGTHRSGSNVMKTSSDSSDNCKHKLCINSTGHRVTCPIHARHPFLQRRPCVRKVKGLVI